MGAREGRYGCTRGQIWAGLNMFYSIDTRVIQNTYMVNMQSIRPKA